MDRGTASHGDDPDSRKAPGVGGRGRERLAACVGLALLVLAYHYPRLLHPLSSLQGFPYGDYAPNLWNFWWARTACAELRSPYATDVLFGGATTHLFFHVLNLTYFALCAPVALLSDNVFLAYNVSMLMADTLGLLFTYRLLRAFGASRIQGLLGASCFVFSAYKFQHEWHLNLQSLWLMALFVLLFFKLWKRPTLLRAVGFGLCASAFLGACWHYLLFLAIALPFLVLWFSARLGNSPLDLRRLAMLGVAILAAAPAYAFYGLMALRHVSAFDHAPYDDVLRVHWLASPLYYVMPGWLEAAWMRAIEPTIAIPQFSYHTRGEFSLFLGVVPLAMLLLYLWRARWRRDAWGWAGLFAFFLLSLGPVLVIVRPVEILPDRFVLLPGAWLYDLPVFSSTKHIARYGVMVLFFLVLIVFSAPGPAFLARRPRRLGSWLLLTALLAIQRVDVQPFVENATRYAPPPALKRALREIPEPGYVMVFPALHLQPESVAMYLQTIHLRTIFYGYLSRTPKGALDRALADPFLQALIAVAEPQAALDGPVAQLRPGAERPALVALLRRYLNGEQTQSLGTKLHDSWDYRLVYEDEHLALWERGPGETLE